MEPEDVIRATGLSKVVGKGLVKIPIENDGMVMKNVLLVTLAARVDVISYLRPYAAFCSLHTRSRWSIVLNSNRMCLLMVITTG